MSRNTVLKQENIQMIRKCFYQGGIWTKNDLNRQTGISLAAITNILLSLLEQQEILLTGKAASTGGRKSKQYILNPDYCHIGKIIFYNHADEYQFLTASVRMDDTLIFYKEYDYQHSTDELLSIIEAMRQKDPLIKIITFSIPGVSINGTITFCDFKEFENYHLGQMITDHFHIDWAIENDVNCAAIAYARQHQLHNMVLLYQPKHEYIGTGIIIHDQLYHGFHHRAGEIRFLPETIKKQTPDQVLTQTIQILSAILDPEQIIYSSDYQTSIKLPNIRLTRINRITDLIQSGLYALGKTHILNKEAIN